MRPSTALLKLAAYKVDNGVDIRADNGGTSHCPLRCPVHSDGSGPSEPLSSPVTTLSFSLALAISFVVLVTGGRAFPEVPSSTSQVRRGLGVPLLPG